MPRAIKWTFACFSLFVVGYFGVWYSLPYRVRVVDDQGRPLAGVMAGMGWVVKRYGEYPMIFKESISDTNGLVEISGWLSLSPAIFGHISGSPKLYLIRRGYMPLRVISEVDRPRLDATPLLPDILVLKKINRTQIIEARRGLENFVFDLCADLGLVSNHHFIDQATSFKNELKEVSIELPLKYSKYQYRDFSCVL